MVDTIKRYKDIAAVISEIQQSLFDYGIENSSKFFSINYNEDIQKVEYILAYPKAEFPNNQEFQMKLEEKALSDLKKEPNVTEVLCFTYHGFHKDEDSDPNIDFIRFDFEPFKVKYAPIHINTYKKKWGDHLTFPDETNLNVSKTNCPLALKIFHKYAEDKNKNPVDQASNQEYVEMFEEGGY